MDPTRMLDELGGVGTARELLRVATERELRRALDGGAVRRLAHGRYALPGADQAEAAALRLNAVISHQSAATWWGWSLKHRPESPVVTVPRKRKVPPHLRGGVEIRYADLAPSARQGMVTEPVTTVIDCSRRLPFDQALSFGDSALRSGKVTRVQLMERAYASPRTGRAAAVRVAQAADGRAENAFESVVRAISLDVPGIELTPQFKLTRSITADLVDESLRLVVECDSWTFHAEKSAFRRDIERYNTAVLDGWRVLRVG